MFIRALILFSLSGLCSDGSFPQYTDSLLVKAQPDTVVSASMPVNKEESVAEMPRHILFKGIAVDGAPADFGRRLESQGYRKLGPNHFVGPFAGVENVSVALRTFKGAVWCVGLRFPALQTWPAVKKEYSRFKSMLAWKYVNSPAVVHESLSTKFREGSGQEAWGFENGTSSYYSRFDFLEGEILLYVTYDKTSGGMQLCIDYVDRLNSILKEEFDMNDL